MKGITDILFGLAVVIIVFIGLGIHVYLVSQKKKREDKKRLMNEYHNKAQRGNRNEWGEFV